MDIFLDNTTRNNFDKKIIITGSKSESNRLLILQKLFDKLQINNLSYADDTLILQKSLRSEDSNIDVHHAGTAMRFLTAYYSSIKDREFILTGSYRMQQRPVKILVDALISIGADITYLKNEGYPPIKIKGKELKKDFLSIKANVSSQYISALLLIAPSLKNGLKIELIGEQTSTPYIKMTLSLLKQIGIKNHWNNNIIQIFPKKEIKKTTIIVESDWSAASYYYSLVALSKLGKIELSYFKYNSLQGDKALAKIYLHLGVKTTFKNNTILLEKIIGYTQKQHLKFDLINTPDIAQTIVVTCFGLNISCDLTGLHTLKIKETDRLEALKIELEKFGAKVLITENSLHLKSIQNSTLKTEDRKLKTKENLTINKPITKEQLQKTINTYDDHRMAMAFAPLSLKYAFTIKNANVVSKSYPDFWKDFKNIFN